ncbi:MAG: GntR family transcriptional regulator [Oscillospiraceae bacterium]|nr:GntR family transcriptional regulator [Oscillospiraceae bacterium]
MYKNVSLSDQIFEKLEEDILFGVYPKGEILTEMKLSETLGVSRTPVREALKMLEQEHLIEDCGKGMLVLGITLEDAMNIYEIRKRIEGLAAARCAVTATEEQLQELKDAVDLQEFYVSRSDSGKIKEQDTLFHDLIYKYSGSAVFYDTLIPLHRKIQKFRKTSIEQKSRANESVAEHKRILDALLSRDALRAEKEMNEHVEKAQFRLADTFNIKTGKDTADV